MVRTGNEWMAHRATKDEHENWSSLIVECRAIMSSETHGTYVGRTDIVGGTVLTYHLRDANVERLVAKLKRKLCIDLAYDCRLSSSTDYPQALALTIWHQPMSRHPMDSWLLIAGCLVSIYAFILFWSKFYGDVVQPQV